MVNDINENKNIIETLYIESFYGLKVEIIKRANSKEDFISKDEAEW